MAEGLVSGTNVLVRLHDNNIRVIGNVTDSKNPIETEYVSPVITAPLAGKTLNEVVCPASHVQAASEFLQQCSKLLIIGTSGFDGDLMQLLSSELGNRLDLTHIVDMGDSASSAYRRFKEKVPGLGNSVVVFKEGFRKYVSGNGIREFAASQQA